MTRIALSSLLSAALAVTAVGTAAAQSPTPPTTTPPSATPPSATPPYAAPPAPPPPPAPLASQPPPAGGNGDDLSHIQGTPVRVGEHNEYYYRFRRTNISTNPVGWMLGLYGVSLSYGISNHLALRGDFNYFDFVGDESTGFEFGAGLPIYFRRTYSGVFLEPGFILREFDDTYGDNTTFGPQVLAGWHWMWDSGLNLAVAFGVGRNWAQEDTESDYDDEEPFVNGYLRFGYAF